MSDLPKYVAELTLTLAKKQNLILGWMEARGNRVKVTWLNPFKDDEPTHDVMEWGEVPRFILNLRRFINEGVA